MGETMAEPLDPLGMWRDVLNQWEQGLNRLSNETMQSSEATRLFNQAMAMSLRLQQGMTEITARYMHALGLPTRADLLVIGERLKAVEDRLQEMSAASDRLPAPPPSESRPPRTKKPSVDTAAKDNPTGKQP